VASRIAAGDLLLRGIGRTLYGVRGYDGRKCTEDARVGIRPRVFAFGAECRELLRY
jgi:hypothetical protein